MPKILKVKNAPDGVWVLVGQPGDFPSGVSLWTPEEKKAFRNDIIESAIVVVAETFRERNIIHALRSMKL